MSNIAITNNSTVGLIVWEPTYEDEILLAAGAVTYAAGTLLGRITASGKLTHYDSIAVDGSEIPVAVLTNEEVFTGAGETSIRALEGGKVRRADLIVHGAGAITTAEADALRDYGIVSVKTQQLGELDNQ